EQLCGQSSGIHRERTSMSREPILRPQLDREGLDLRSLEPNRRKTGLEDVLPGRRPVFGHKDLMPDAALGVGNGLNDDVRQCAPAAPPRQEEPRESRQTADHVLGRQALGKAQAVGDKTLALSLGCDGLCRGGRGDENQAQAECDDKSDQAALPPSGRGGFSSSNFWRRTAPSLAAWSRSSGSRLATRSRRASANRSKSISGRLTTVIRTSLLDTGSSSH